MDYIPNFIDRKTGKKPIEYDIPVMEKYLKETYGITVYQEQVMLLSRLLADFTRGESDTLRKAMGKKQKDKLDKLKPKFIQGGKANGHDEKVLEKVWADWEKFASYAFNKSHATCYSWVAYQTAYLKAHYPAQYMAANLSRNLNDITEITKLMDECKSMGISVLGPDVNESRKRFSANAHGDVRFGLAGIKGVGEGAVEAIIKEREQNGPYKDVFDVVERVNLTACNRKALENMAISGAFDSLGTVSREQFFAPTGRGEEVWLDQLMRYGQLYQQDAAEQKNSLFGSMGTVEVAHPKIIETPSWPNILKLDKERELVGIYLSAHPLDEYRVILEHVCNTRMTDLADLAPLQGKQLSMGGIVTELRDGMTKRNTPYGRVKVEDLSGTFEFAFFDSWTRFSNLLRPNYFVYMEGHVGPKRFKPEELELVIDSVQLLPQVKDSLVRSITLSMNLEELDNEVANELAAIISAHPGKTNVCFELQTADKKLQASLQSRSMKVEVTNELVNYVKNKEGLEFHLN